MAEVVQIKGNKIELPEKILKQLNLTNGQDVEIEVVSEGQIKITPISKRSAKERLKELLDKGFHLGKVYEIDREAIYGDIDR